MVSADVTKWAGKKISREPLLSLNLIQAKPCSLVARTLPEDGVDAITSQKKQGGGRVSQKTAGSDPGEIVLVFTADLRINI